MQHEPAEQHTGELYARNVRHSDADSNGNVDCDPDFDVNADSNVNTDVEIVGIHDTRKTVCTGIEMFRKLLDSAQAGDNCGLLLRGVDRKDIERGMVICKPGSIKPHTKFDSEVYVLSKEEGGRHTPFTTGYRPQFYFRTTDVTGTLHLPEGVAMVMPGENIKMTVELIAPIAMEQGSKFAIREGGRTVGAGTISKVYE